MFHEKDVVPTPQQAAKTDRNLALQLREDACATLAQKVQVTAKEPEAKRRCGSTAEVIVKYLEEKDDKDQQTETQRLNIEREKLRMQEREMELRVMRKKKGSWHLPS
eukprot:scpid107573/ scgid30843/ 